MQAGQEGIKINGYSLHEGEYNIARMFKETIAYSLDKYKGYSLEFVSLKLGISPRTLARAMREWNIQFPKSKKSMI